MANKTSCRLRPSRSAMHAVPRVTGPELRMAPFGIPVVPDVYDRYKGASAWWRSGTGPTSCEVARSDRSMSSPAPERVRRSLSSGVHTTSFESTSPTK